MKEIKRLDYKTRYKKDEFYIVEVIEEYNYSDDFGYSNYVIYEQEVDSGFKTLEEAQIALDKWKINLEK